VVAISRQPIRVQKKIKGKQSTRGGCDGSRRRWWPLADGLSGYKKRKKKNNQPEVDVMAATGGGGR